MAEADPATVVLLAGAAVHAFIGLHHAGLLSLRRESHEFGAVAIYCFALAFFSVAAVYRLGAESLQAAAAARRVELVSLSVAVAAFVRVARLVCGRGPRWLWPVTLGSTITAIAIAMTGLAFDPALPTVPSLRLRPSALAMAYGLTACVVWIGALRLWLRNRSLRAQARWVIGSAIVAALGSLHDLLPNPPLGEIRLFAQVLPLTSGAIGHLLLSRILLTTDSLAQRTTELKESHRHLQQVQEELVRKEQLAAVGELSTTIAHHVNLPLGVIDRSLSKLRNATPEVRPRLLAIMDQEIDRLNRIVHDLLTYARPLAIGTESIGVVPLLRNAVEHALATSRNHEVHQVHLDQREEHDEIEADANLLDQAFRHIIVNALQAMNTGGTLNIIIRGADYGGGRALVVTFVDTGGGIDPMVLDKAKAPFFTTRPDGTGLGLAIVERIVAAHDGELNIRSVDGGAAVEIVLPRQRSSLIPDLKSDSAQLRPPSR